MEVANPTGGLLDTYRADMWVQIQHSLELGVGEEREARWSELERVAGSVDLGGFFFLAGLRLWSILGETGEGQHVCAIGTVSNGHGSDVDVSRGGNSAVGYACCGERLRIDSALRLNVWLGIGTGLVWCLEGKGRFGDGCRGAGMVLRFVHAVGWYVVECVFN